jgi:hypothetical protein
LGQIITSYASFDEELAYVLSGVSYVLGSDSQRVGHISVNQKT